MCLGIETSCDETALALVRNGKLIDSVLASQASVHALFGGVVPELASREHYRFLGALYDELARRQDLCSRPPDLIAVARGPGLLGSLLVGVGFAKALALGWGAAFVGVNHLHAHLLAAGLSSPIIWPAIGLLASGGHTQLYLMRSPSCFIQLGRTMDDAAGEAFDKTGKLLGFDYPAGREIDACAAIGSPGQWQLPRSLMEEDSLDFSFSGLKAACAREIDQAGLQGAARDPARSSRLHDFCACINEAIAETMRVKLERAIQKHPEARSVILAGGVAANSLVRDFVGEAAMRHGLEFMAPEKKLCVDNAAMIAFAGWLLHQEGHGHMLDLETIPRGRAVPDDFAS